MSDIEIRPDFVTEEEEKTIVDLVMSQFNNKNSSRQSLQFGNFHPCSDGIVNHNVMPEIFDTLRHRLIDAGILDKLPDSVSVNIYPPKSTILPHVDNKRDCGNVIPVIGLLADCPLIFRSMKNGAIDETSSALKETYTSVRRGVFIMKGEKRHEWTHQTSPIDTLRISVVFRTRKNEQCCIQTKNN